MVASLKWNYYYHFTTCIFLINYIQQPVIIKKPTQRNYVSHWRPKNFTQSSIWKRISFENLAKYAYRWGISFFYECISVKALNHEFILNIALSRKRKHSNYKLLDNYFPIDGKSSLREGHHSNFPKDDFRVKYFEALDLVMAPIRTRFDQPSFIAFFLI